MHRIRCMTFVAALIAAAVSPAEAVQHCVSREKGRSMLEAGQIAPFPDAAKRAGILPEQVQGVDLCPSGGRYSYEVEVLRSKRKAREIISADPERPGRKPRR